MFNGTRSDDGALRHVAMVSLHTSPLDQPGTGDAGGMNVYVTGLARVLAERGVTVDVFTRATDADLPAVVPLADGVTVRHIAAGPQGPVAKEDLPGLLPEFTAALLRACRPCHGYDLVHTHYWLSGLAARDAACRWDVPLVHSAHTLAKVKNVSLAPEDSPEPDRRVRGEEDVVGWADALVANTEAEARDLITRYRADPDDVHVVPPGVDTTVFRPGTDRTDARGLAEARARARAELGLDQREPIVLFAGRVQPLKAPDVLIRAVARLRDVGGPQPRVVVLGGPSGSSGRVDQLFALARACRVDDQVRLLPPVRPERLAQWYRAADLVAVPSRSESYGLVAAEAQACGAAVVAAEVGGLASIVDDGVTGVLVPGHDPDDWARELGSLLADPVRRAALGARAHGSAARRSWDVAAEQMLAVYRHARTARSTRYAVATA